MLDHPYSLLLAKHKKEGAILDSNLLLLLVVGSYDVKKIAKTKRTEKYTADDFILLRNLLRRLDRRIATPNIFTEVDNLSRLAPTADYKGLSDALRSLTAEFIEIYKPSVEMFQDGLHDRLGLTDCITLALAREKRLVITDDFPLANRLQHLNCDVININHLRQFG